MPPSWSDPGLASPADLAVCRALIRAGSRTFHSASLVLPGRVRDPAHALYAFCRLADDAVDLGEGGPETLALLSDRLDRAYAGRPLPVPADRAFADVVARFAVPRALPAALLEGFAWDGEGRRYRTLSDLTAYAARVAGTVGAMMAVLMGARGPQAVARACDLGVAMQLTNIARDVGEDARNGRLYLPADWLEQAGLDPEAWLARPVPSAALGSVVARLLRVADALYERAEGGIAHLPADCRPAILAARLLYAEIGREVERRGLDSVTRRAVVRGPRKAHLLARALALGPVLRVNEGVDAPPLDETRFLVDAVVGTAAPAPTIGFVAAWVSPEGLRDRALWVLDLFDRLDRRRAEART